MANSSTTFASRGTTVRHGVAAGTIAVCRFVARDTDGKLVACPTAVRPCGVSPFTYAAADDAAYHCLGFAHVETDGSGVVGDYVKAAADGSGKGIKDSSPGFTTGGRIVTIDATTNIAMVELVV